jgi:hypothetical protein
MERSLAAASSEAGVALSAAVDAHTTAAGRLMHLVDCLSIGIVDLEARNAAVALLLDLNSTKASTARGQKDAIREETEKR